MNSGSRRVVHDVSFTVQAGHFYTLPDAPNVLAAVVNSTEFLGEILECQVGVGDATLTVRQGPVTPVQAGDQAFLEIAPQSFIVLPDSQDAQVVTCNEPF